MKNAFFSIRLVLTLLLAVAGGAASVAAADYWLAATEPSVVTNNDCGFVSAVAGNAVIRRSFMTGSESTNAHVADRINSGDELIAPHGGRIEWTSGNNMIVVLGADSQIRLDGLRSFARADGMTVMRLDVTLLKGECRVQVRLNSENPEAVAVTVNGADVLVTRGDVEVRSADGWSAAVINGDASARVRRGGVVGAPFAIAGGAVVGSGGEARATDAELAAIKARLPFSFEVLSSALPPLPAASYLLEAP